MENERRSKSASEILQTLHSLSIYTEDEILAMSQDEVRTHLSDEGIDLTAEKSKLKVRINAIRGQQRLLAAREGRQAQDATLANRQLSTTLNFDQIRAEVQRRLGLLLPAKTQAVQAYFNRFKEAEDDDLPGLLDDLQLLDQQNEGSE